jgi:hypothetical protein
MAVIRTKTWICHVSFVAGTFTILDFFAFVRDTHITFPTGLTWSGPFYLDDST